VYLHDIQAIINLSFTNKDWFHRVSISKHKRQNLETMIHCNSLKRYCCPIIKRNNVYLSKCFEFISTYM